MSEGLDFADHAGRAVVITGLPFATSTDPKVWWSFSHSFIKVFYYSKVCLENLYVIAFIKHFDTK